MRRLAHLIVAVSVVWGCSDCETDSDCDLGERCKTAGRGAPIPAGAPEGSRGGCVIVLPGEGKPCESGTCTTSDLFCVRGAEGFPPICARACTHGSQCAGGRNCIPDSSGSLESGMCLPRGTERLPCSTSDQCSPGFRCNATMNRCEMIP